MRQSTFRRRHRLRRAREYDAVYAERLKKYEHPLIVRVRPTDLPEPRLGLAIGRRVGNAVRRNAVKRRIREAFRLIRANLPKPPDGGNYDLVISARRHEVLKTRDYADLIARALESIHRQMCRRARRNRPDGSSDP